MRHWKVWDAVTFLYQSKHTSFWKETWDTGAEIVTTHNSKARVWCWLWMMNSNLNLAKPSIILMVRKRNGWDAVNCPNVSKPTQSWCERWTTAKPTLTPPVTETHVVVTIIEHTYQSHSSPTIHHMHNVNLEGLRCYEIVESINPNKLHLCVKGNGYWN